MLTLHSPAKINFFLKVLRRRPDGYHDLSSLLQAIDLFDLLHFQKAEASDSLTTTHPTLSTSNNLIGKAAALFRQKTATDLYVHVHLEKNIPIEAGLGGGSSNAATTLYAMNLLAGTPATEQQLLDWSAELGSDVPFFFSTGTALCTGRGEHVQNVAPLDWKQPLWVIKPPQAASTQKIFQSLDYRSLSSLEDPMSDFLQQRKPFNDLEPAVMQLYPELASLKKELGNYASREGMSGSGTAFFAFAETLPPLAPFMQQVKPIQRKVNTWYTRTID